MATRKSSRSRSSHTAEDKKLGQAVADSAQKIWLAGLGAFSRAKTEGDRMFEVLVEQGKGLRDRARGAADEAMSKAREQTGAAVSDAQGRWDKLEQVFEERVSRALGRLGVLTNREVGDLSRQVKDLNESVRSLMGGGRPARGAAAKRRSTAKKPRAKSAKAKRATKAKKAG